MVNPSHCHYCKWNSNSLLATSKGNNEGKNNYDSENEVIPLSYDEFPKGVSAGWESH